MFKFERLEKEKQVLNKIIGEFIRIVCGKVENYKRDDEDIELLSVKLNRKKLKAPLKQSKTLF